MSRGRDRPLFSHRQGPPKLPSKILIGTNTNRGPTSANDSADTDGSGLLFFLLGLPLGSAEGWSDARTSVGGLSIICAAKRPRTPSDFAGPWMYMAARPHLIVPEPDLAVQDGKRDDMIDEWFGFPRRLGDRKDLCTTHSPSSARVKCG